MKEPDKFEEKSQDLWQKQEKERKRKIFMMDGARAKRSHEGWRQKKRRLRRRQGSRFKKENLLIL
jgi:hypothetical protein